MSDSSTGTFPITIARKLEGMIIERDLELTFWPLTSATYRQARLRGPEPSQVKSH